MDFLKSNKETYYDVLELSKDCSTKEIKEAFVRLSKEYHPDKSKNVENAHDKFIKLNEAYSVLSRNRTRYDEFLKASELEAQFQENRPTASAYERWQNYGYQKGVDPRKYSHFYTFYNTKNYQYDPPIPGSRILDPKQRKHIVIGLWIVVAIGFVMNFNIVRKLSEYRDSKIKKTSEINSIMLSHTKHLKELHGDETLSKLLDKEIRNMTEAEAKNEYEKRHSQEEDK